MIPDVFLHNTSSHLFFSTRRTSSNLISAEIFRIALAILDGARSHWKNNTDQTCRCLRDSRLLAIMCAQFRSPPDTPTERYLFERFKGGHLLRDASLLESCTRDQKKISVGALVVRIASRSSISKYNSDI